MGNMKMTRTSFDFQKNDKKEHPGVTLPALCSFFVRLPEGLSNRLKVSHSSELCHQIMVILLVIVSNKCMSSQSYFKRLVKAEHETSSAISIWKHKESSSIFEVSLEKQLQAWKENPIWTDQSPYIKVSKILQQI